MAVEGTPYHGFSPGRIGHAVVVAGGRMPWNAGMPECQNDARRMLELESRIWFCCFVLFRVAFYCYHFSVRLLKVILKLEFVTDKFSIEIALKVKYFLSYIIKKSKLRSP